MVKGLEAVPCVTEPKSRGLGVSTKLGDTATPVPVTGADWFTVPSMLSVAVRVPAPEGEKVKMMVQLAEMAMVPLLAQVPPERAKSPGFVPVRVKSGLASVSAAVPEFVTVTVSPADVAPTLVLAKLIGGVMLSEGLVGAVPVPLSVSVVETPPAALMVSVVVSALVVLGVKTRFMVQDAPAARVPPFAQVPVPLLAKSEALPVVIVK